MAVVLPRTGTRPAATGIMLTAANTITTQIQNNNNAGIQAINAYIDTPRLATLYRIKNNLEQNNPPINVPVELTAKINQLLQNAAIIDLYIDNNEFFDRIKLNVDANYDPADNAHVDAFLAAMQATVNQMIGANYINPALAAANNVICNAILNRLYTIAQDAGNVYGITEQHIITTVQASYPPLSATLNNVPLGTRTNLQKFIKPYSYPGNRLSELNARKQLILDTRSAIPGLNTVTAYLFLQKIYDLLDLLIQPHNSVHNLIQTLNNTRIRTANFNNFFTLLRNALPGLPNPDQTEFDVSLQNANQIPKIGNNPINIRDPAGFLQVNLPAIAGFTNTRNLRNEYATFINVGLSKPDLVISFEGVGNQRYIALKGINASFMRNPVDFIDLHLSVRQPLPGPNPYELYHFSNKSYNNASAITDSISAAPFYPPSYTHLPNPARIPDPRPISEFQLSSLSSGSASSKFKYWTSKGGSKKHKKHKTHKRTKKHKRRTYKH